MSTANEYIHEILKVDIQQSRFPWIKNIKLRYYIVRI